jgi:ABC-2 type transport system ATP-binding protein
MVLASLGYFLNIDNYAKTRQGSARTMDTMIGLQDVTKKFGDVTAVDRLSLDIRTGEFYGFLGPNGAGKTTTIKMMTGLFSPTSGSITIGGFDVQRKPLEAKMRTGYIPDQPFLYEKLTGREFLHFSAGLYKMAHRAATEAIRELTNRFEIGPWIDRRTEHYSQGMRQRLVIVAALLHDPKVLIIDEPMVGLDPRSAQIVKEVLKQKSREGTAIFMSTHSLPVAEELCDRVGIIKNSRLVFEDSLDAFHRFKDRYNGKFESMFLELTR